MHYVNLRMTKFGMVVGILQYAIDNGMIDLETVQKQIEMNRRKDYLNKHPFAIWKGNDKKWHTYLPDEDKGRIPRKRNTKKDSGKSLNGTAAECMNLKSSMKSCG